MKFKIFVAIITLLVWVPPCLADDTPTSEDKPESSYYVSGLFGLTIPVDSDLETASGANAGKLSFNSGTILSGAVGTHLQDFFRLEAEWAYKNYDADQADSAGAMAPATGEVSIFSLLVNGYRDIPTGTPFTPYLGVGVGAASIRWKNITSSLTTTIDDKDLVFAFQFMAGVSYPVSPSFFLTAGYRLFATSSPKFAGANGSAINGEVINHDLTLGVRFSF